uniref:hypothetical protein n=1 Tax=Bacteroides finegoldii TaxID=338188 RepID=UPI003568B449
VHAILQRQRCNENITKKTGTLSDAYYKTLNFVYNNYFPKEVVDELISSKNKKIDWLKIEIKNLKQERETLLQIIRDMY